MNIPGIFHMLTLGLFKGSKKKITRAEFAAKKRELMANPDALSFAQHAGNSKRLAAHRRSCEAAYGRKLQLVNCGRGKNTIGGIPPQFIHS